MANSDYWQTIPYFEEDIKTDSILLKTVHLDGHEAYPEYTDELKKMLENKLNKSVILHDTEKGYIALHFSDIILPIIEFSKDLLNDFVIAGIVEIVLKIVKKHVPTLEENNTIVQCEIHINDLENKFQEQFYFKGPADKFEEVLTKLPDYKKKE